MVFLPFAFAYHNLLFDGSVDLSPLLFMLRELDLRTLETKYMLLAVDLFWVFFFLQWDSCFDFILVLLQAPKRGGKVPVVAKKKPVSDLSLSLLLHDLFRWQCFCYPLSLMNGEW